MPDTNLRQQAVVAAFLLPLICAMLEEGKIFLGPRLSESTLGAYIISSSGASHHVPDFLLFPTCNFFSTDWILLY